MISFASSQGRFHLRVAAIIIADGHLLLHRLVGETYWTLPGGRVDVGETAEQALVRELQEELSILCTCGELVCTGENFFEHDHQRHHEIGLYFSVTVPEGSSLNAKDQLHWGDEDGQTLEFCWFAAAQLNMLDFRPAVLKEPLSQGAVPAHFVQDQAGTTRGVPAPTAGVGRPEADPNQRQHTSCHHV